MAAHVFTRLSLALTLLVSAGSCTNGADTRADELAQAIRHEQLETFVRDFALRAPVRAMEFAQRRAHAPTVETLLQSGNRSFEDDPLVREILMMVYAERDYEPIFVLGTQLTTDGEAVMQMIDESYSHGFWPDELHAAEVHDAYDRLRSSDDVQAIFEQMTLSPEEEQALLEYLRGRQSLDETVPAEDAVFSILASTLPENPVPRFAGLLQSLTAAMEVVALSSPELELTLASAYLRYAREQRFTNVHLIPDEEVVAEGWDIDDPERAEEILRTQLSREFRRASQSVGFAVSISGLEPPFPQYALLREGHDEYVGYVEAGGWEPIDEDRELRRGNHDDVVPLLRQRLAAEHYFEGDLESDEYDSDLERAIEWYQTTHQLHVTGRTSPETWDSLNRSADQRLAQIRVAMNRWRDSRIGTDAGGEYIHVNIPDFHAELWDLGELVYRWRVLVGSRRRVVNDDGEYEIIGRTPLFSDEMEYIVFNPYWNVPPSILFNEMLPEYDQNPLYFEENHFEIVDTNAEGRPRSVRQLPGPWNALGTIKFLFPNNNDVYMHDTPNRRLFDRDIRAFSHGCIRVDQPRELAALLLRRDRGWDQRRTDEFIDETFALQEENWIGLRRHIPVHLEYYSVRADEDHRMNFLADIYTLDRDLVAEQWDRVREQYGIPIPADDEPDSDE